MISDEMLTGRSEAHLAPLSGPHRLQPEAVQAFLRLQQAAAAAGFDLQPASTFRDFDRQRAIWNGKFHGERPLLDHQSQPLEALALDVPARCEAILRWSALPGTSRHHWGTDLDIYDPSRLPDGQRLQLEPWEYLPGGYFAPLTAWLTAHMAEYGFYRPFTEDRGGVAVEPWHLSYRPLAAPLEARLTPETVVAAWQGKDVAGADWLCANIDRLFTRFIRTTHGE
ncbi:M15 family metallopeptidase [Nissabacter sp. SGAir0207]|uniref:M15 family metallopeptidase n=1 Tax=Nissabacter sp. SGAir0207 TaxID=2126321 RepID=UPI0010CD02C2|nr:M15 family metallopeptidase [Nissabacter sp. SGAir0207]QCR35355.1 peptidase M15 [Nissabacter sp. SGAir0207]